MKFVYLVLYVLLACMPYSIQGLLFKDLSEEIKEETNSSDFINSKKKLIESLVDKAITHFLKNPLDISISSFTNHATWRQGEVFIYLLDEYGSIMCHGDDNDLVWQPINIVAKSLINEPIFEMIKVISKNGGWVDFMLFNGYKSSYVKQITKKNKIYYIGAGFFPESREYSVEQNIKNIVALFNSMEVRHIISILQNPFGAFIKGDSTPFLLDFEGTLLADPMLSSLVNQNIINFTDKNGVDLVNEELKVAKSNKGYGWLSFRWKNELHKFFVHRVNVSHSTSEKNQYCVGMGYCPDIKRSTVATFLRNAISHVKAAGIKTAFANFSNAVGDYIKGPLTIFVYDYNGKNLADGEHPELVGQTLLNRTDGSGKQYVKEMIKMAKRNKSGFLTIDEKNDHKTLYFEAIDIPDGRFIIGTGFFPASKAKSVRNIVNRGLNALKNNELYKVLSEFKDRSGEYQKGDLQLFIYTKEGTALINGNHADMVWQNFSSDYDKKSRNVVKEMIDLALVGGGWIEYSARNAQRRVYVKALTVKDSINDTLQTLIIGSGYFI